jgi:PIN domain nuclease of toxin-antitoxin system
MAVTISEVTVEQRSQRAELEAQIDALIKKREELIREREQAITAAHATNSSQLGEVESELSDRRATLESSIPNVSIS